MKGHVVLDEDRYMVGHSQYPIAIGDRGSKEVEIPNDLDMEKMDCYCYVDGEFVFDEGKWAERVKQQEASETQLDETTLLKLAIAEIYEMVYEELIKRG